MLLLFTNLNPNNPMAYNNLGSLYQQQGKFDDAITQFKKVIELNPGDPWSYNGLESLFQQQGKFNNVAALFKGEIGLNPNETKLVVIHYNLGLFYHQQDKLDEAIIQFQKTIELFPDFAEAHYNLACLYAINKEYAKAIESLKKATIFDPKLLKKSENEEDFDNIRQSSEFQKLIASGSKKQ